MSTLPDTPARQPMGRFCWADLGTSDPEAATSFYGGLLGWRAHERRVGRARFRTIAQDGGPAFASLYRLTSAQVACGVPSLWLPYASVPDLDAAAERATLLGGEVVVTQQVVEGFARICVIADPTGALIGLWQAERERMG